MASVLRCANSLKTSLTRGRLCAPTSAALTSWLRYHSSEAKGKTVRIGCASGFWGDTAVSAPQLVHQGNIDYLVFDYLAEITMSLLVAAQQKAPNMGYAPDFVQAAMAPLLKDIKKKGIRVVSNAGGLNPSACVLALQEAAKKSGIDDLKVAMVTGDNLIQKKDEILQSGVRDLDSGREAPQGLISMNAYLGATPVLEALNQGADIVVTGRLVDSAVVLGPLMHEFGWKPSDYDLLAAGSLAGHIVECGAQATGGVFTDWEQVNGWDNMGFPIVECTSDGQFIVTKPPKTGGLVSTATVAEQIVYEIGDPRKYMLPDVTCDFSQVNLNQVAENQVHVSGAKGTPPSDEFKVSGTFADGFRCTAVCNIGGVKAALKGQKTAESIFKRCSRMFKVLGFEDFSRTHLQMLGTESTYGPHANPVCAEARETVVWMSVEHKQRKALELFSREIAPAGTGMAPGLCGIVGGRPRVSPIFKLFSFLYPKSNVEVKVHMDDNEQLIPTTSSPSGQIVNEEAPSISESDSAVKSGNSSYTLEQLAYARSGDKADTSNIGVVARHPSYVPYIRNALTEDVVRKYLQHILEDNSQVTRYELPGIHGFNFVLTHALGGGGVASLRSDPQGKGLAQMLLSIKLESLPDDLLQ
ncbi:uncharacterized protein [Amphiura filiformis]|uniref:uncharacterized protein n=1 Tax=Amphiura filiformis TaxID=82378 RepID=UPI003B225B39